MPDVAVEPQPAKRGFFTKANASEYARKANDVRWHSPQSLPVPVIPQPEIPSPVPVDTERLSLLVEQITLTRASLNSKSLEPKDRAQLVRALCGLLDQQRIARGEPLPGSRRPAADRSPRAAWPPTLVPRAGARACASCGVPVPSL